MKSFDAPRFLFVLAVVATAAWGDGLTGKVVDPDGAVVPNAEVAIFDKSSGSRAETVSSEQGDYEFRNLSPGTYLIEAKSTDGTLRTTLEVLLQGDLRQEVQLGVAASTVRVLVSATGTPISEQEVAKSIDVVDIAQINQRDETYIAEALRIVPGLQIQTQAGGVFQMRTRGLSNPYTAVLIDGLRFRDASAPQGDASGFMANMNVTDLGSAEFMRGSGSSLYGTNAIAGVLNLNSNESGGRPHGAVRVEGGGLGMFRSTLNLAGGLARDRLVYSGGISYLNVTGGVRGKTPNSNTSGQIFAKYRFSPKLSLSGRMWGSDAFQRSVYSPAFTPAILANFPAGGVVQAIPLADSQLRLYESGQPFNASNATFIPTVPDPDAKRDSSFNATSFVLLHEPAPNTSWRASYQLVSTKAAFINGPGGGLSFDPAELEISNFDGRTQQFQLRLDNRLGFNQFTGGYEFENEFVDSLAGRPVTSTVATRTTGSQNSHSLYAQDLIRLLDSRLTITVGGRMQFFDLQSPSFTNTISPYETARLESPANAYTGDLSAAYFAQSNTKLRAHLGNGYRAPSLYERFGSGYSSFSGSFTYYGDPRLTSETSLAFDGGIDQWFLNEKVRASVTFYYTDLKDTIIFANTLPAGDGFGRFFGYANQPGGGISRGVELSTQFAPTRRSSVTMSYTLNNAELRNPTVGTTFYQALRTAKHIYSILVTQSITRRLSATVDFYALGDQFESPFGANGRILAFEGPKKFDLVVNYNVPLSDLRSVDFYFKTENLFNIRYTDNGYLAPGAWTIGGMKFNF